jgi:hypothetical protein
MYITSEKLRLSRISAEYLSAENEPKIMWLAEFSAEFLHQPAAVYKKNTADMSNLHMAFLRLHKKHIRNISAVITEAPYIYCYFMLCHKLPQRGLASSPSPPPKKNNLDFISTFTCLRLHL